LKKHDLVIGSICTKNVNQFR